MRCCRRVLLEISRRFRMPCLIVSPEAHSNSIIFISLLLDNAYKYRMLYLSRHPLKFTIYGHSPFQEHLLSTITNETFISIELPNINRRMWWYLYDFDKAISLKRENLVILSAFFDNWKIQKQNDTRLFPVILSLLSKCFQFKYFD